MVFRPLAIVLAAGLSPFWAAAQQPTALADGGRVAAPLVPPIPQASLSPEKRGDIYMARKMYREAIEAFREGSPKDAALQNKIGIAYHQMQQLDLAKKNYERAAKLKPDYMEAHNNLGTIYYARKSYRKAVNAYKKALRVAPNDSRAASIYSNLGTAYFARKKYDDATEAYRVAIKLDPEVFESRGAYGVMLRDQNVNIEERARFHYSLAKIYAKDGRTDLALQYLRRALEEGFRDKKKLEEDPEFTAMREMPEFKELLALEPRVL